jgi:hypothetical protein
MKLIKKYSFFFFVAVKLKFTSTKEEKPMIISSPTNFEHTLHVHLNPNTGDFIVINKLNVTFFLIIMF